MLSILRKSKSVIWRCLIFYMCLLFQPCIAIMTFHHKPGNIKKKERDEWQRWKDDELKKNPRLHTFFSAKASISTASNVDQQDQTEILQCDDTMECDEKQDDDQSHCDLYSNDLGLWSVDSVSEMHFVCTFVWWWATALERDLFPLGKG